MLENYTVLDFTDVRGEIGPMVLGDLGAEVIRVEPPGGVSARAEAPFAEGVTPDLASLSFQAFNRNKRSVVLDPGSAEHREMLTALIGSARFLFESWPNGPLAAWGIDPAAAHAINPNLIWVRLSAFGSTGPHAGLNDSDIVIAAMGGPVSLQGAADRPPVRVSVPQAWRHAGVEAAVGAMAAHWRGLQGARDVFVDLSAQATLTWTMLNAMDAYAIQGFDFPRGPGFNTGTTAFDLVFPCGDGYVVAIPNGRVLQGCLPEMIAEGIADPALRDLDWEAYDRGIRDPNARPLNIYQAGNLLRAFFASRGKQALFTFGLARDITITPVNTLAELLSMEHLKQRDYWRPLAIGAHAPVRAPGLWVKSPTPAVALRRPVPALDADGEAIRSELRAAIDTARALATDAAPTAGGASSIDSISGTGVAPANTADNTHPRLPFDGVTVADFAWVGVGPISSKFLADHGAHVIRIESEARPDVLRGSVPYKDAVPGLDRSQFFGDFNTSKQSINLDLRQPEARVIAREIIARSDVLIESFVPGVIGRMGFSYEEVRRIRPDIIMVSTCLMGQTGHASQLAGYGYHAGALAGFYEVTGWPDLAPNGPWVAYTDTVAPRFIAVLLGAALDRRRRTGQGAWFDVAQIETALHFLAPELFDQQLNGRAATRIGNRSMFAAPQGCYPCAGDDEWIAIGIDNDHQWQRLCAAIARPDLANDTSLNTANGRIVAHDRIDAAIIEWTRARTPPEAMHALQAGGVPAGHVQRSRNLLEDPQYAHRGFYRWYDHPEMGHIPYAGHPYRISGYDNGPRAPAPTLGQHTLDVLTDFLGFDDERIAAAYAAGAVG